MKTILLLIILIIILQKCFCKKNQEKFSVIENNKNTYIDIIRYLYLEDEIKEKGYLNSDIINNPYRISEKLNNLFTIPIIKLKFGKITQCNNITAQDDYGVSHNCNDICVGLKNDDQYYLECLSKCDCILSLP